MKLHQALIVATLSLSVLVGDTFAQEKDRRMFGNGRFLKKMRDDIFGSKPKPTPAYDASATAARKAVASSKKNVPTPALPAAGNRPTPIDTQSTYKYKAPQLQSQPSQPKKSVANNAQPVRYKNATRTSSPAKASVSPKAIEDVTQSAKKQTLAFGMLLQTRGKDLVVTQIDPAGNANKAGVRKGDTILGAGGIDFGSMLEFNEITDVLQDGDQLEFVVSHGGKKAKKLILFGEAPDMTTREVVQSKSSSNSARTASKPAANRSNLNQYQLAPVNTSMHSVIESPTNQVVPASREQNWRYNSGRRATDKQIEALESASVRGETILNVPN